MALTVVLVEPQFPGNVGSVARAMLNFGVDRLVLVRPCPITNEARNMAVHAQRVLDEAVVLDRFDDVVNRLDYLVAFAARTSSADRSHLRVPVGLPDAAHRVHEMDGEVGLVFGREDFGLSNEDVLLCDLVCTIATSDAYRSLNLSHAVSLALYEMTRGEFTVKDTRRATAREREILHLTVDHLLANVRMPDHRREITMTMWRRLVGRAGISTWDYHRLMGLFSSTLKSLKAWPPPTVADLPDPDREEEPEGPAAPEPDKAS